MRRADGEVETVSQPVTSVAAAAVASPARDPRRRRARRVAGDRVPRAGHLRPYAAAEDGEDGEAPTAELTRGQLIFAFAVAIGFTVIVFKVSPALITDFIGIDSTGRFVIVEGAIRVGLLIGYLALISLIPDLRRVFQYHAAEHKAINAYEDGAS